MKIDEKDMEQLAHASRLDLAVEESAAYTESLNEILDYLDILHKIDTSAVEPAGHVVPLKNVFREDELQPSLDKELALANAPKEEAGAFVVPRII
ncbi:Asp-tRNA(Asn)/Glu-tRNA(Gln) amidotransferase subunit GatC [Desulforamulus ferrireducens]|uniref:Aspartyl/glutamyl-tRNA(Asn/Gln) amidotransferase subunit C n=1 Tax=Desulforamulus ferrireducens TaxID=1833852 RepID=A0A1S6IXI5_9FIRM|nr:Asp-tRNA(Asn)/Glu-tRNA(Gln) amidotransferase subunit GatC [Desulforamulus ferrireducens]AQS59494.1 asparaginyl/glutamyl-tRNA amidotransferase subunit C [Desulforamulus ferrireducens]